MKTKSNVERNIDLKKETIFVCTTKIPNYKSYTQFYGKDALASVNQLSTQAVLYEE